MATEEKGERFDKLVIRKLTTLETVILGVQDTDNRGLVGDIKEIKESLAVVRTHETEIALIKQRCQQIHGDNPGSNPGKKADPDDPLSPLAKIPKTKIVAFIFSLAAFIALVIYNLGGLLGWWTTK